MTNYIGNTPGLGERVVYRYLATASQQVFTGTDSNGLNLNFTNHSIEVYVNGIRMRLGLDYTHSNGNTVTFTETLNADDEVTIVAVGLFNYADAVKMTTQVIAGDGLTGGGTLETNVTVSGDFATQAEAEAGIVTNKLMSPLRTIQAINENAPESSLVGDVLLTTRESGSEFGHEGTWLPCDNKKYLKSAYPVLGDFLSGRFLKYEETVVGGLFRSDSVIGRAGDYYFSVDQYGTEGIVRTDSAGDIHIVNTAVDFGYTIVEFNNVLYISRKGSSIYKSSDFGFTWTGESGHPNIYSLQVAHGYMYALVYDSANASTNGVYRSATGAPGSWSQVYPVGALATTENFELFSFTPTSAHYLRKAEETLHMQSYSGNKTIYSFNGVDWFVEDHANIPDADPQNGIPGGASVDAHTADGRVATITGDGVVQILPDLSTRVLLPRTPALLDGISATSLSDLSVSPDGDTAFLSGYIQGPNIRYPLIVKGLFSGFPSVISRNSIGSASIRFSLVTNNAIWYARYSSPTNHSIRGLATVDDPVTEFRVPKSSTNYAELIRAE